MSGSAPAGPVLRWPDILPLPVVVDADVLSRSVDHALREGYAPAVVSRASPNYGSFTGITVFVTARVLSETFRRFGEIAAARSVAVDDVKRVWDDLFSSRIRVVDMFEVDDVHDERVIDVAQRDADDVDTARLAVLLAPCALLTDNWEHFQSFRQKAPHPTRSIDATTAYALDVRDLGQFLSMLNAGTIPPRLAGLAVFEGGKAFVRWVGRDGSLVIAVLLLGGLALYLQTDEGRRVRERVIDTAKQLAAEHGPALGAALEVGVATAERLTAFAVQPGQSCATSLVARELAGRGIMTTVALADHLASQGYRYSPISENRKHVRAWLIKQSCFWEPTRGSWTLGYHVRPRDRAAQA
jgi:hypothetical protein